MRECMGVKSLKTPALGNDDNFKQNPLAWRVFYAKYRELCFTFVEPGRYELFCRTVQNDQQKSDQTYYFNFKYNVSMFSI